MVHKIKLDDIDRHILKVLQTDGRMTNVELARRIGISAPPCLRRVRTLEDNDVIRGYHADVNPEALGYSVMVFAFVGLNSQAESDLRKFENMVRDWPEVRECHMLVGEVDFILKITAHDWDHFQQFLTSKLTPAPNVSHVKTALAIRSDKDEPGVPVDDDLAG
jgi:DNA-binding Lrp family transcriptional regulator